MTIQIDPTIKIEYPEVNVGDQFLCHHYWHFCDGTYHDKGEIYTATKESKDFFSIHSYNGFYEKVS